ncbi:MAG: SURF1 family protein [Rudaea sp.]|nr:SURF1 family protein [Rudaea sp.]
MTARRWHRPSWFALALTASGMAAFIALGLWQLDRAGQKERLLTAFRAAAQATQVDFDSVRNITDMQHYPHVRISGHFLAGRSYLLDEQMHEGQLGVHAIGVFAGDGEDHLLLVDRGWTAWSHAPGTSPELPPLPAGEVALNGIYAPFPGGGIRVGGDALPAQTAWPKLTLYLDQVPLAADLGKPLLPRLLLLDPQADSGFVRAWTPNIMPPERHRAYALQWFAFAIVALMIFVGKHWRKVDNATK